VPRDKGYLRAAHLETDHITRLKSRSDFGITTWPFAPILPVILNEHER
jgi:hypothetical protein